MKIRRVGSGPSKRSRPIHEGCTRLPPPSSSSSSFRTKEGEKRTLHPRKGVSRARPTRPPSAERQYPSCDTPSYEPGFRVSRAAPGGERPRLTQTQNRSPFVALLATPSEEPSLSLSLSGPRRLVTLVTISQLWRVLGEEGEKREEMGGG